ncbi:MAG: hypothetical protein PVI40_09085 [Chlamydiota bacterium]|jgi:hypothetical protein
MTFFSKNKKSVTFATACWEEDWKTLLLDDNYLNEKMISPHLYDFEEKILIINNVKDRKKVEKLAQDKVQKNILTGYVIAEDISSNVLDFFQLKRSDFKKGDDAHLYANVDNDWIYYNALAPLSAIYSAKSDYLLYMTGDSYLKDPVSWIDKSVAMLEKKEKVKVANLIWNGKIDEVKKESYKKNRNFFFAKEGFSDQLFLVSLETFKKPIYHEIREDSHHFPRGDVFEKRVFSYLKNRGYERLIFKHGSYTHIG